MLPEFPGWNFLQRHVTRAADLQQGIARDRVEWLDASVEQYRQATELGSVERTVLLWQQHGDDFDGEQRQKTPRQDLVNRFHAVFRFAAKSTRLLKNWTINPTPTSTHEKYGVNQLGLCTTCRIVPLSSVS